MLSIQTSLSFPLSSVKPFESLLPYRDYCLASVQEALGGEARLRSRCPACESEHELIGRVCGLEYARCQGCASLFLHSLPSSSGPWAQLLAKISQYRDSPKAFHSGLARERNETVYLPKLEWIQNTLRMHGIRCPRLLEVVTPPSDFSRILAESDAFSEVVIADEMKLISEKSGSMLDSDTVDVAVLLESLDRVDEPEDLLHSLRDRLLDGGLCFITALVSSGFDVTVLGLRNVYLYPPDRTNCFSIAGLERLLTRTGFTLLEVSTPGVLDVEIVLAHLLHDPSLPLSAFERQVLTLGRETREAFQAFLQQNRMSSFARIVGRKNA